MIMAMYHFLRSKHLPSITLMTSHCWAGGSGRGGTTNVRHLSHWSPFKYLLSSQWPIMIWRNSFSTQHTLFCVVIWLITRTGKISRRILRSDWVRSVPSGFYPLGSSRFVSESNENIFTDHTMAPLLLFGQNDWILSSFFFMHRP